jgi:hypothetical protein
MSITFSVGNGATNRRDDVLRVQGYLNAVRFYHGRTPIAVDGVVGPETLEAITAFQRAHAPFADGRVVPDGGTMAELKRCAGRALEAQLRSAMLAVLHDLDGWLARKCYRLPPELEGKIRSLRYSVGCLRPGPCATAVAGFGALASVGCACFANNSSASVAGPAGPVVAAPVALATAEAMALAILAVVQLLTILQHRPPLTETIDEVAGKVGLMMAELLDSAKTGVEALEDTIKRLYFPRF